MRLRQILNVIYKYKCLVSLCFRTPGMIFHQMGKRQKRLLLSSTKESHIDFEWHEDEQIIAQTTHSFNDLVQVLRVPSINAERSGNLIWNIPFTKRCRLSSHFSIFNQIRLRCSTVLATFGLSSKSALHLRPKRIMSRHLRGDFRESFTLSASSWESRLMQINANFLRLQKRACDSARLGVHEALRIDANLGGGLRGCCSTALVLIAIVRSVRGSEL